MYERITLDNLSRYDSKLKNWLGKKLAPRCSTAPMALTEKAGVVSCWPVGGTSLNPTVDFVFTETSPASGDKGPENPSTIAGVSEVKVSTKGSNLFCIPPQTTTRAGVDITIGEDGIITFDGTSTYTAGNNFGIRANFPVNVKCSPGMTMKMSFIPVSGSATSVMSDRPYNAGLQQIVFNSDGSVRRYGICTDVVQNFTYTIPADLYDSYIGPLQYLYIDKGASFDNYKFKINIELLTDVGWEVPAAWNTHAIELGNTYYGGTVDLATGIMTVTVYGEQIPYFSSVYNEYSNTIAFRAFLSYPTAPIADSYYGVSDRFEFSNNNTDVEHWRLEGEGDGNRCLFFINKSRLDISDAVDPSTPTHSEWIDAANAWLADTPVFLVYGVATPQIIQLTPVQVLSLTQSDKYTPRLNTIYTDAQAVQVGYVKSPIREEFELQQAIVAQGGGV